MGAVTPGQADEVPELFTRWYCAGWPVTGWVTADAWQYALPAEQQFWRSLDAEHAALAARQPQPAPDCRRALLDIIDVVEHLDEPGPEADHIRLLAEYGLGEAGHPDGVPQPAPGDDPFGVPIVRTRKPEIRTTAQPAPELADGLLQNIDALHGLIRDILQSMPDTADEQEWRDRAGALHVCDLDGQPYRAYTEEDL